MSDYKVGSIDSGNYGMVPNASGGAQTPRPQVTSSMPQETQGQTTSTENAEASQALAVQSKTAQQQSKSKTEEAEKTELPLTSMANISLKFKIDEETRNITVYVIDRESKRVLRSIPPEEMNKLQAGDLVELLA